MGAFAIAQIRVKDMDKYREYQKQVPATVASFGGRIIVAEPDTVIGEGEWPADFTIVIEFPSMEKAHEWYGSDEYAGPLALRKEASTANAVFVRRLPGT